MRTSIPLGNSMAVARTGSANDRYHTADPCGAQRAARVRLRSGLLTIHSRQTATHATAPACTGAPARCRATPAHVARRFGKGMEERGRQRCGRNHGLLPPLLLFPHMGGRRAVPHGTGSSTHKKTPTWYGRGQHTRCRPFPSKGRLSAM